MIPTQAARHGATPTLRLIPPRPIFEETPPLSRRAYAAQSQAASWEELWEAGSYYERIAELLEDAHDYAVFVGWQVDSRIPIHRPARPNSPRSTETLKEKVVRLCEEKPNFQVYFLMWDHAYFYVLERESLQYRRWDNVHPRVHFVFDNRHPYGGSHHEKLVIIDGKIALCGGIDLCDERWDSPKHLYTDPRRSLDWQHEHHGPYHDLAVQVTGPVCAEIQDHVAKRWELISSIPFPAPPQDYLKHLHGGHQVYVSRTIASVDGGERGVPIVREIEFLVQDLIKKAEKRIILEGQYYWSATINEALIKKFEEMKGRGFELTLILADTAQLKSLTKMMGGHELKLLARLEAEAEKNDIKLVLGTPFVYPPAQSKLKDRLKPRPVYIHSKLILIDDKFLSIGSANLASRAFRVDTELNLTFEATSETEKKHIQRVANSVLEHWNLIPSAEHSHIKLNPIRARAKYRALKIQKPWLFYIPWRYFFDPAVAWLYPLKRRFRTWDKRQSMVLFLATLSVWLAGWALTLLISDTFPTPPFHLNEFWPAVYSLLLYSTWIAPVPFLPVSILAAIHLEPATALRVVVSSLWVASLWGYVLSRMFPTAAGRFYRKLAPKWIPERLGLRSFPYVVSVIADPRVSLRSKIAYQGLYCVPMPWFALANLLVLAGALYVFCRAITITSHWAPLTQGHEWISHASPFILVTLIAFNLGIVLHGKKKNSSPIV